MFEQVVIYLLLTGCTDFQMIFVYTIFKIVLRVWVKFSRILRRPPLSTYGRNYSCKEPGDPCIHGNIVAIISMTFSPADFPPTITVTFCCHNGSSNLAPLVSVHAHSACLLLIAPFHEVPNRLKGRHVERR